MPIGLALSYLINLGGMLTKIQIWSIPLAIFSVFFVGVIAGLFPPNRLPGSHPWKLCVRSDPPH